MALHIKYRQPILLRLQAAKIMGRLIEKSDDVPIGSFKTYILSNKM